MKKSLLKRFVTLILAMMMVASISAPAFAATYPTAKLTSKSASTVKRGRKIYFYFTLKSGSYRKVGSIYRAQVELKYYNPRGSHIGTSTVNFSGNFYNFYFWFKPGTYSAKGRYRVNYRTYFNKYSSFYRWMYNSRCTNKNAYFNVK